MPRLRCTFITARLRSRVAMPFFRLSIWQSSVSIVYSRFCAAIAIWFAMLSAWRRS